MNNYEFETCLGPTKLNEDLLEKQGVTEEAVQKMIPIYQELDAIWDEMRGLDPKTDSDLLNRLYNKWMNLQFKLQALWGFPRNANYFRDFELPHCTCPVWDNLDRLGTETRIISEGCIYHGQKTQKG